MDIDSGSVAGGASSQEEFSYGHHALQNVAIFNPFGRDSLKNSEGFWIIYVHGGAWRDPLITEESFLPTINHLISNTKHYNLIRDEVTAFASIGYRLSPHPSFPQDVDKIPKSQLRNGKHPDHLNDVLSGLSFLQSRYGFGSKYILIGHSCGGTLALQTAMWEELIEGPLANAFQKPEVLVSVAGIYDLPLLRDRNPHPAYNEFLTGAFGADEEVWKKVSPARWMNFTDRWPEGKLIMLVSSKSDELIDESQIDCMAKSLVGVSGTFRTGVYKDLLDQKHDEIWEGAGLAETIFEALSIIRDI